MKIRLIELFAGIGSQAKALERLGVEFEHHTVVEFDENAITSYNAIHNTNFKSSDIKTITASDLKIDEVDNYCYILTYSFPCQDLSLLGKKHGMKQGSDTRSSLLWEVGRLLDELDYEKLPDVLLMENVPQVINNKNKDDFKKWQLKLESLGYTNFVKILNAKDYGIPQNRKRCFMVSFLGRKNFTFPEPIKLEKTLKDYLSDFVDEDYYLSSEQLNRMNKWKSFQNPLDKVLGKLSISPTITTRIVISDQGGINASTKLYCCSINNDVNMRDYTYTGGNIRVFTELECWKLMGFDENDYLKSFNRLSLKNLTKNQIKGCLYKQAGNSIVVDVLYYLFIEIIKAFDN